MKKYIHRYLESAVLRISKTFPVLLLTGPRQVGKTTLLQYLIAQEGKKRGYVSLDDFKTRTLANEDPALFLQQNPPPLLIDEVQYAPKLFTYIKIAVDRDRDNGMYWLTGSQQLHMMKGVSESLAGRVGILSLLGLSQAEIDGMPQKEEPWMPGAAAKAEGTSTTAIFSKIIKGSFPALFQDQAPKLDEYYGAYLRTYVDRDVRDIIKVTSLASFEKFVSVCAARTASLLNYSDLARDADISVPTAKEWMSILEAGHHVFLLRPYYRNLTKRLIKAPKLYFLDTGLAAYLTGWRDPGTALRGAYAGQLFETLIISEIIKSYVHRGKDPRFFSYFRTKEQEEVDFLIDQNGILTPVEVKLGMQVNKADLRGIEALKATKTKVGLGAIIAPVEAPYHLNQDVIVEPPSAIS